MLQLILLVFFFIAHSQQYVGRVVCYYRSDNVYRAEGFRMQPQEIDPNLCTHVIYHTAYLHPEEAIVPSDSHVDLTKGGYKKMVKLKESNPNLKVMLSLSADPGGRDLWPLIAARKSLRQWFSTLVVEFLRAHRFDGLDIDWQIHNNKRDSNNYLNLLMDISSQMELNSQEYRLPRLQLSVLLPAQIQQLHRHFHLANVSKYVDFINVASMDYWALDPYTVQHHAPLYRNVTEGSLSFLNVDESIKYYLFKYVPPEKLVLGIPTYGRSFQLENTQRYELGSRCKYPGDKGFATNSLGTLAYFEICTYINEECWSVENTNLSSIGPYAHFGDRWVGYDDVAMISVKAKYVREKKLGGLMFWTIDQDDFRGYCYYKYALVRAGKFTLNTGIQVTDASMLEQEELRWQNDKEMGYYYPKPTIQQPNTPWTIPDTPTTELSSSSLSTTTTSPTTPPRTPPTSPKTPPTTPSTTPTTTMEVFSVIQVETTTSAVPVIVQEAQTSTSTTTKPDIALTTTPISVQDRAKSTDTPVTMTSVSRNPNQSDDKNTLSTFSEGNETENRPASPLGTTQVPTISSTPSIINNEIDSDTPPGVNTAIQELNRVLATVNQVVADINEISRQQGSVRPQRNLTIDPSFLDVLQPLFNLRNTADIVLENSEDGNPNNSTIRVQSDVKKYRVRSSGPGESASNQTFTPSLKNITHSGNATDMFSIFPGIGADRRYILNSGRDIININLNISINNNYFDRN